jgi:excinuclease ABC subunit A
MWVLQRAKKEGYVLYSGPPEGLNKIEASKTREYLFTTKGKQNQVRREPQGWLELKGVTRNNLSNLDVAFPLKVLTSVTGISGSGKSSLVSQVLVELIAEELGHEIILEEEEHDELAGPVITLGGRISAGMQNIKRLVNVDQKPIGRTPRSKPCYLYRPV